MVNNGLPAGLHFKDIVEGDLLEVKWNDAPNEVAIVVQSYAADRRRTYKGYVDFKILRKDGPSMVVDGDQVVRKVGSVWDRM